MNNALLYFIVGFLFGGLAVALFLRIKGSSDTQWNDRFSRIASDVLRQSHESFLQLAEGRLKQSELSAAAVFDKKSTAIDELIKPVKETLGKMDTQLRELEVARHGAYKELFQAVTLSNEAQQQLRAETSQLLQALRTPTTRGQWGEIQIRRILEMTGMAEHTNDFASQYHVSSEDGSIRPDYLVRLPGERCIVIDSKVPLTSYLDGTQTNDANLKQTAMEKHAKQVREHILALSSKTYWNKIEGTTDFVVLFVPGDHFLAGALDCAPDLFEFSAAHNVVLATPMTLVALLRTVALAWRQEGLRKNAEKLGSLGGELYAAISVMAGHVTDMGARLTSSVDCYNKMIGSLERNVLTKARRLRDFGAKKEGKDLPEEVPPVEKAPRTPQLLGNEQKDDAA